MDNPIISVCFYDWDGDACRVYQHDNGDVTADLYRGRRGIVSVAASDVLWEGIEINEAHYKKLVLQEIALRKTKDKA
jgi:hypothetical protein